MVSESDLSPIGANMPATYYHATRSNFPAMPKLEEMVETDVCVIGGGLTGVSTALHLTERGYSVVLLESQRIGNGASGRNGGQLVSGYSCDMNRIRQEVGVEASKTFWAMGVEALAEVDARVTRHAIACDQRSGYFFAALNQRQMDGLAEMHEEWRDLYGYEQTTPISREDVGAWVGTDIYHGGVVDTGGGQIHPLSYLQGLARAAITAGARVFEHSAAIKIERGAKPTVHTENGRVRASFLVLAGNAYLGGLVPEMHQRLARVSSFVATTAPLAPDLAAQIMPGDVAVADCNAALDYYRLTADHRLLFGAGAGYAGREPLALRRYLSGRIQKVFPALTDIPLAYAWSGHIGITVSRIPDFGRLEPSIYYAQGFSGHGVALTGLAGKLMAEAIAGDAERFDMFAAIKHRRFPGGPVRTAALVLAMAYYKFKDRL
ncbi:MAG: FAD-binding oxidoreductase, partial [Alphaproteobacteria bacterium]|nr:FAD-binding oxidoreductase [Alphaproteobacteria bacterium]